jgi:hypothetical protein
MRLLRVTRVWVGRCQDSARNGLERTLDSATPIHCVAAATAVPSEEADTAVKQWGGAA